MATGSNGTGNWRASVREGSVVNNNNGTVTYSLILRITNAATSGTTLRLADYSVYANGATQFTAALDVANVKDAYLDYSKYYTVSKGARTITYSGFQAKYNDKPHGGSRESGWYSLSGSCSFYIPALSTWTVSYNANGGTGAPANQTKTEQTTLYLSGTIPTRIGYRFLGWSTSSSATTASYQPNQAYTANAGLSLYAVWEKKYASYVKVNGAWKLGITYVKENGAWKEADLIYVKENGSWKTI